MPHPIAAAQSELCRATRWQQVIEQLRSRRPQHGHGALFSQHPDRCRSETSTSEAHPLSRLSSAPTDPPLNHNRRTDMRRHAMHRRTVTSVHTLQSLRETSEEGALASRMTSNPLKALLHAVKSMLVRVPGHRPRTSRPREPITVLLQRLTEPLLESESMVTYRVTGRPPETKSRRLRG